jgi:hypothetical protein
MTPEMITALIGVGGLAAIVPKIIDGVSAWVSGRAKAEKGRNQTVLSKLSAADRRAESEAEFRRALEEYAGALRLLLVNAGVPVSALPPWPVRVHNRRESDQPNQPN